MNSNYGLLGILKIEFILIRRLKSLSILNMTAKKPATKRPVFIVSTVIVSIILYISIWSLTNIVIGTYSRKSRITLFTTIVIVSLIYLYWSAIEEARVEDEEVHVSESKVLNAFRK